MCRACIWFPRLWSPNGRSANPRHTRPKRAGFGLILCPLVDLKPSPTLLWLPRRCEYSCQSLSIVCPICVVHDYETYIYVVSHLASPSASSHFHIIGVTIFPPHPPAAVIMNRFSTPFAQNLLTNVARSRLSQD